MSWLKIDDKFARHPKVLPLSSHAFRLHVVALCHCAEMLTDGQITERDVRLLMPVAGIPTWKKYVNELISAGLWTVGSHGWSINDYLAYNPSSVQVKERRERHAAQQKAYRRSVSRAESRAQARETAVPVPRTRTRYYNEEPTTFVPKDVTSEVDAGQVIDFSAVLKDVS